VGSTVTDRDRYPKPTMAATERVTMLIKITSEATTLMSDLLWTGDACLPGSAMHSGAAVVLAFGVLERSARCR
jgi:hypothetical protein